MTVFVDEVSTANRQGKPWAHLAAYTLPELHAFARSIGLRPSWFHDCRSGPHYDVTPAQRLAAVNAGAHAVDRRTFAKLSRVWRALKQAQP